MSPSASAGVRHPPGRAGRLWLEQRIAGADRAAHLLDRKLRLLRQEEQLVVDRVEATGRVWASAWLAARRAGVRAAALGDDRPLVAGPAREVAIRWTSVMGVRHPTGAQFRAGAAGPRVLDGTAALQPAREAYTRAVEAAAEHAVALATAQVVAAEIAETRRRVRAIRNRWLPALEAALAAVRAGLDEEETADAVRRHRVDGAGPAPRRTDLPRLSRARA